MAGNAIIALDSVATAYEGTDRPTIRNITLSIGRGEFVVIGGPNGAGKTTLLETINAMLPLTRGNGRVCGHDLAHAGILVRRKVGYLLQNFAFDPLTPFTVREVVLMGRYGILGLLGRPREKDFRAAEEALHLLGIEDLAETPIGRLSGGQQQKVLIAQNLAKEPEVLLLDEPFSNLDLFAREKISGILEGLAVRGMPVLMVSHAFDGIPDRPIRILVMNAGTITLDTVCQPREVEGYVRQNSAVGLHA